MQKLWFVVFEGRETGVFSYWRDAEEKVVNYKGTLYMPYTSIVFARR